MKLKKIKGKVVDCRVFTSKKGNECWEGHVESGDEILKIVSTDHHVKTLRGLMISEAVELICNSSGSKEDPTWFVHVCILPKGEDRKNPNEFVFIKDDELLQKAQLAYEAMGLSYCEMQRNGKWSRYVCKKEEVWRYQGIYYHWIEFCYEIKGDSCFSQACPKGLDRVVKLDKQYLLTARAKMKEVFEQAKLLAAGI